MSKKQDTIFADGLFFELAGANAPSFIKGKLSIDVVKFTQFLNDHQNKGGYVNIDLKESKSQKGYAVLNSWKPSEKPKEGKEIKNVPDNLHVSTEVDYPEEENKADEIPF